MHRFGLGYMIAPLKAANDAYLKLGGTRIESDRTIAHFLDGDVLTLSICEAILGTIYGKRSVEEYLALQSDSVEKPPEALWLLRELGMRLKSEMMSIEKIDSYIVIEKVFLREYYDEMRQRLADALSVDQSLIFLGATDTQGIGEIGKGIAMEVITLCVVQDTKNAGE